MSRIQPVERPGLLTRVVFWFTRRMLGKVPTPMRVAANHPKVFRGYVEMERALMAAKTLDIGVKRLVSLRAATRIGCPF